MVDWESSHSYYWRSLGNAAQPYLALGLPVNQTTGQNLPGIVPGLGQSLTTDAAGAVQTVSNQNFMDNLDQMGTNSLAPNVNGPDYNNGTAQLGTFDGGNPVGPTPTAAQSGNTGSLLNSAESLGQELYDDTIGPIVQTGQDIVSGAKTAYGDLSAAQKQASFYNALFVGVIVAGIVWFLVKGKK